MFHVGHIKSLLFARSFSRATHLYRRHSSSHAPTACSTDIYPAHPTTVSLSIGKGTRCPLRMPQSIEVITDSALSPYKYTSGRWLRRDKLERDARFLTFDFNALRTRVLELSPGAASITSYEKKEGGYNRVFIFTCDNSRRVVARIPTSVAGPARLTTNSEVATISYSRLEHLPWEVQSANVWCATQFSQTRMSHRRRSSTGATTLPMLSAASILSQNMQQESSCTRNGQWCLESSKLLVSRLSRGTFSK